MVDVGILNFCGDLFMEIWEGSGAPFEDYPMLVNLYCEDNTINTDEEIVRVMSEVLSEGAGKVL